MVADRPHQVSDVRGAEKELKVHPMMGQRPQHSWCAWPAGPVLPVSISGPPWRSSALGVMGMRVSRGCPEGAAGMGCPEQAQSPDSFWKTIHDGTKHL